jgi:citrate lyase beta subunit
MEMRTFLFLAMQRAELSARLVRAASRTSATIVLDLEDTLQDVLDRERTQVLKAAGREDLITLAREHRELFEGHAIGVRVNGSSGPEAERDFEALGRASRFVELECIVLPKVGSEQDLANGLSAIKAHDVACRSLVPIVETRRAMANLDEMLAAAVWAGVPWLVYGHYDFSLDSGWWPFPEHNEPAFWELVEPMIARIEAAGLGYVHPPYLQIHDDAGLAAVLDRVRRVCNREFGFLAISRRQATTAEWLGSCADETAGESSPVALRRRAAEDPLALARRIVGADQANHRPGAGFALDPRRGEFISPHAYVAACQYLRREAHE